jgi:sugar phosphate isomerase/epimerase
MVLQMAQTFRVAAITDEYSPDLEKALSSMAEAGMTGAELRVIFGKNILNLTDEELDRAIAMVRNRGMETVSIASPVLKCVLPDAPEVDARFQQDSFASAHNFADQPRLAARAFEIANRAGAGVIRVFSYWRTVRPEECFTRIVDALGGLAEQAQAHGVIIGLENEHACNIGTGLEVSRLMAAIDHPNLKVVWDPANALVAGESPFPEGYRRIPPSRIAHVHAKDCTVVDHRPTWCAIGDGAIDWNGQVAALAQDGYRGWLSLETHWSGPGGDKHLASVICGKLLVGLSTVA